MPEVGGIHIAMKSGNADGAKGCRFENDPASNLDAVIYYRKDANVDTLIDKVVFNRKKAD